MLDDFYFAVGNSNMPGEWAEVSVQPQISIRPGAGVGGSDRLTFIWPPGAIENQWLQVAVGPRRVPGCDTDVFYFGNAVGESGFSDRNARVSAIDEITRATTRATACRSLLHTTITATVSSMPSIRSLSAMVARRFSML